MKIIFDIQQWSNGQLPSFGTIYIGPFGGDPLSSQIDVILSDQTTIVNGFLKLDFNGRPIYPTTEAPSTNIYVDDTLYIGCSMQILDSQGIPVFDQIRQIQFVSSDSLIGVNNVGTGEGIFRDITSQEINLKTLTGSGSVTISDNGDEVNIDAAAGITNVNNVGGGADLVRDVTTTDANIKTLLPTSTIDIVENPDTVELSANIDDYTSGNPITITSTSDSIELNAGTQATIDASGPVVVMSGSGTTVTSGQEISLNPTAALEFAKLFTPDITVIGASSALAVSSFNFVNAAALTVTLPNSGELGEQIWLTTNQVGGATVAVTPPAQTNLTTLAEAEFIKFTLANDAGGNRFWKGVSADMAGSGIQDLDNYVQANAINITSSGGSIALNGNTTADLTAGTDATISSGTGTTITSAQEVTISPAGPIFINKLFNPPFITPVTVSGTLTVSSFSVVQNPGLTVTLPNSGEIGQEIWLTTAEAAGATVSVTAPAQTNITSLSEAEFIKFTLSNDSVGNRFWKGVSADLSGGGITDLDNYIQANAINLTSSAASITLTGTTTANLVAGTDALVDATGQATISSDTGTNILSDQDVNINPFGSLNANKLFTTNRTNIFSSTLLALSTVNDIQAAAVTVTLPDDGVVGQEIWVICQDAGGATIAAQPPATTNLTSMVDGEVILFTLGLTSGGVRAWKGLSAESATGIQNLDNYQQANTIALTSTGGNVTLQSTSGTMSFFSNASTTFNTNSNVIISPTLNTILQPTGEVQLDPGGDITMNKLASIESTDITLSQVADLYTFYNVISTLVTLTLPDLGVAGDRIWVTCNQVGGVVIAAGGSATVNTNLVDNGEIFQFILSVDNTGTRIWNGVSTGVFDPSQNQTITGNWDFTNPVTVPAPVAGTDAANQDFVLANSGIQDLDNYSQANSINVTSSAGELNLTSTNDMDLDCGGTFNINSTVNTLIMSDDTVRLQPTNGLIFNKFEFVLQTVIAGNTNAVVNTFYSIEGAGVTLTLPATPVAGQKIGVRCNQAAGATIAAAAPASINVTSIGDGEVIIYTAAENSGGNTSWDGISSASGGGGITDLDNYQQANSINIESTAGQLNLTSNGDMTLDAGGTFNIESTVNTLIMSDDTVRLLPTNGLIFNKLEFILQTVINSSQVAVVNSFYRVEGPGVTLTLPASISTGQQIWVTTNQVGGVTIAAQAPASVNIVSVGDGEVARYIGVPDSSGNISWHGIV